jgi:hypothetical protein
MEARICNPPFATAERRKLAKGGLQIRMLPGSGLQIPNSLGEKELY